MATMSSTCLARGVDPDPHLLPPMLGEREVIAPQDARLLAGGDLTAAVARVNQVDETAPTSR
jgi:hypothetical protein